MKAKLPPGTLNALWSDPSHWRSYFFYYSKEDPRLMVPKRTKLGWTLNFAHPKAYLTLFLSIALPVALILSLPKDAVLLWMMPILIIYVIVAVCGSIYLSSTKRYEYRD